MKSEERSDKGAIAAQPEKSAERRQTQAASPHAPEIALNRESCANAVNEEKENNINNIICIANATS